MMMLQLAGWTAALIAGGVGRYLIVHDRLFWGVMLYLLTGAGGAFLVFINRAKTDEEPEPAVRFDIQWLLLVLSIAGGITAAVTSGGLSLFSSTPSGMTQRLDYALYGWLAMLALGALACYRPILDSVRSTNRREWLCLGGLLLLSLAVGLFRLTSVPFTVHGDEGMVGLNARNILNGGIPSFFSVGWYNIPQFFFWIPSASMYLFGDSLFGLRMGTVIVGTLSVAPFFWLCRSWWGTLPAVLAGVLLVTNHWFIHLLHCGVNYVQVSFFTITIFCLLYFMNRLRSVALCFLASLLLGLSLMSYQANHLLPVLWLATQVWLLLLRRIGWRWFALSVLLPAFTAALVIAPLYINDSLHQGNREFMKTRASNVVIWNAENQRHLDGVYRANGNFSIVLREQAERALLAPIKYNDKSIQYAGGKPMLDPGTGALFLTAVFIALYLLWDTRRSLPLLWIVAILLAGGALTVDAPFFPRLAGTTALYPLLVAGVFHDVLKVASRKKMYYYSVCGVSGLLLLYCATDNMKHYFGVYAKVISPTSIHASQTLVGRYLAELPDGMEVYMFPGPHNSLNSGTVRLLAKDVRGREMQNAPNSFESTPLTVIIDSSRSDVLAPLRERLPNAVIQEHYLAGGQLAFTTLTVEQKTE